MPLRRYHTPSRVRQTSSASILPPLDNRITVRPPSFFPIPGPLVETGAAVARECEVAMPSRVCFGLAEGDGAGDAVSVGAGETSAGCGVSVTDCASETGCAVTLATVAASTRCCLRGLRL